MALVALPAVVAEVAIVALLAFSTVPVTVAPSTAVVTIEISAEPSNDVAVPVTAPEIPIVLAVASVLAVATFLALSAVFSTLPRPTSALVTVTFAERA